MKLLRKLICWMDGHRSICIYTSVQADSSILTGWKCERCGYTNWEKAAS